MIEATLSSLRKSSDFFNTDEIIQIVDGRKKIEIGYFVPKTYAKEFEVFANRIEKKKKLSLLKRVAKAQKKNPIGNGASNDGIY